MSKRALPRVYVCVITLPAETIESYTWWLVCRERRTKVIYDVHKVMYQQLVSDLQKVTYLVADLQKVMYECHI